jgi:hypothetical protein
MNAVEKNWWQPQLSAKLRQGSSSDEIGAIVDATAGGGMFPIKFAAKTVEVKKRRIYSCKLFRRSIQGRSFWEI